MRVSREGGGNNIIILNYIISKLNYTISKVKYKKN